MTQKNTRNCGLLIHPTSFPSPFGIGDLGAEARGFLKTASQAGVRLWQILPLGPTGYGDSPYSSRSCFAGNEYLIDLRSIPGIRTVFTPPECSEYGNVDYNAVFAYKLPLLKKAAAEFLELNPNERQFAAFCRSASDWLDDYALYRAVVDEKKDSRWFIWEPGLRNRDEKTLNMYRKNLAGEIEIWKALQYFFFSQWNALHEYAASVGIRIVGDIPIFAASDSVDVWVNRRLFKFDSKGNQKAGAGVPPDAFSPDGQYWGNPVYDWDVHAKDDYAWWKSRMKHMFSMVDVVRIDHFRGFESYWEVPAGSSTAREGKWVPGPGMNLLKHFKKYSIIAEDLGVITDQVKDLLEKTGWPGMKIIQFSFDLRDGWIDTHNPYLPHNYNKNCAAYSGTHDNQTTRGWFNSLPDSYKDMVRRYFQCSDEEVVWQVMRSLLASSADTVIFPVQDLLGLDDSARMNAPSTVGSFNWSWRMEPGALRAWMTDRLREYIRLYGRV